MEKKVLEYLDSSKDDLIKLAMDLIKIPTINPPGRNYEDFSDFTADWLSDAGLNVKVVEITDRLDEMLRPEASGPRFHVLANLNSATRRPILHFNGHYDVVPPAVGWTKDPFDPIIEGKRLYGLGSTDMKGGISAFMMAVKAIIEYDVKLKGNITLSITPDEEYSSKAGLGYLFEQHLIKADYAIIGEPSGISNVVIGQKGALWGWITTHGSSAHGSTPLLGLNAFEKLVKVAIAINERIKPKLEKTVSIYDFRPEGNNKPTIMLGGMVKGANRNMAAVPEWCSMSFDRRTIPEETIEEAEAELLSLFEELGGEDKELRVKMKVTKRGKGFVVLPNAKICTALKRSIKEIIGDEPAFIVSTGWTEAAYFVEEGVQTAIYGPGLSECAHAEDEYVLVNDLVDASKVYALTIMKLLT